MKGEDFVEKIWRTHSSNRKIDIVFFNEELKNVDFMLILQNPGNCGKEKEKIESALKNKNRSEFIEANLFGMRNWIKEKNSTFWTEFISLFNKILKENLSFDNIFNKIYLTDAIKIRGKTEDINKYIANSSNLIKMEIEHVSPKLIFTISSRSWEMLQKIYNDMFENLDDDDKKIIRAHGKLFKIKNGPYIIPLAHFSGRNNFLRTSYFDYLQKGLNKYKKIIHP